MTKKIDINKILDSPKKNLSMESKPIPSNWWIVLVLPALYLLFCYANYFTENQAIILGILGSTVTSFLILLATLNNEKRLDFRLARKSAKILSEILESIYNQIERINNGSKYSVDYPENWLDLYTNCSTYLQYEYLQYLLLEFDIIKKINDCISNGNEEGLASLLKYRKKSITDWTFDFEIITVRYNLFCFASGLKESKPWKQEKRYIEFADFFRSNYSDKVKQMTVEYLKKHDGTCDVNDANQYVMARLRQDTELSTGKYKYVAIENKAMLNSIFKVYLSLNNDDSFKLCWGELTLNS